MPNNQITQFIPSNILEFKGLCKDIFTSEKPMDIIVKNKKLLNSLTGISTYSGNTILNTEGQSLFDWDDSSLTEDELFYDESEGRETDLVTIEE